MDIYEITAGNNVDEDGYFGEELTFVRVAAKSFDGAIREFKRHHKEPIRSVQMTDVVDYVEGR